MHVQPEWPLAPEARQHCQGAAHVLDVPFDSGARIGGWNDPFMVGMAAVCISVQERRPAAALHPAEKRPLIACPWRCDCLADFVSSGEASDS